MTSVSTCCSWAASAFSSASRSILPCSVFSTVESPVCEAFASAYILVVRVSKAWPSRAAAASLAALLVPSFAVRSSAAWQPQR